MTQAYVCRDEVCVALSSSDGSAQNSAAEATSLPVVVDDVFVVSGYMGDGEKQAITEGSCKVRAGEKRGNCHRFEYSPPSRSLGWGGVFWQYPANNWGSQPGFLMPEGAKTVSVYAWADSEVKIRVGAGILAADDFAVLTDELSLSDTPQRFVVDLSQETYRDVTGAFGWQMMAPASGGVTLYFDDIVWTADEPSLDTEGD